MRRLIAYDSPAPAASSEPAARVSVTAMITLWSALFWAWLASEAAIAVLTYTRSSGGAIRDRGSQLLLWIVLAAALSACGWIGDRSPWPLFGGAHWLKPVSVGVLAIGLAIRWTAIATLGPWFSANVAIRPSQTIRRTGLYHFVRHPSYFGLLLICVAIGLRSRDWVGLAVALAPSVAALLYRIRVEETALMEAFGAEYAAYRRTTKRLIPGVY